MGRTITVCVRFLAIRVHNLQVQIYNKVRALSHRCGLVLDSKQLTRGDYTLGNDGIGQR